MSKVIGWQHSDENAAWRKWREEMWIALVFGKIQPREPKEDDNVKLAWVIINKERKMVGLDTVTRKAYKLRDDRPTWIRPLQEIEYDSFERWCTSFDV